MPKPIRSTYRVQFRPEFTLDDAEQLIPYLRDLGISHLYASPFLQAAPGSTHGYDVVDYGQINAELGGPPALNRLTEALARSGLGMVLDIVPNHMAISPQNPWWWDVLRNGPSSRFASYFDVEWNPPEARHANAVLVPVLGDHYGRVLEAGEIQLAYDEDRFTVHYHEHVYPVDPTSIGSLLAAAANRSPNAGLAFLAGAFSRLPDAEAADLASARRRYQDGEVLHEYLARLVHEQPEAAQALQAVIAAVNAEPDALDEFLRRQNYRLALWKISAGELGYRRFFDINTMIGLRMEDSEVYHDTHLIPLDLLGRGVLDGLRIDHPDGLLDPARYFKRLRQDAGPDAWIVIEKILEPGEALPPDWPVQGTVGYDYLNRVNGLWVDPSAEAALTRAYEQFTGQTAGYAELVHEKKLMAARDVLGPDLNRLTELLLQVCERHRQYRDYTRSELRGALAEVAACLPVYRTYTLPGQPPSAADTAYLEAAVAAAQAQRPDLDPRLLAFVRDLLLRRISGAVESELAARFQQFTGPVMAKGVEDTTFYIYNRFVSLNEVGGDPGRFGVPVAEFHQANAEAQARWPDTLLATSTHDTKRSEDMRARLNVISEMPAAWIEAVQRWSALTERYRVRPGEAFAAGEGLRPQDHDAGRPAGFGAAPAGERWPDRSTEYLIYQTLVGVWPVDEDRLIQYLEKAGREAKVYTTWTAPQAGYEAAVAGFVRAILADPRFTADLETFVAAVLEPGRINALAQTLLKLTSPGVPDIYQGADLWHLALVDPDNRRPVDYAARREMLAGLRDDTPPEVILAGMDSGLPKLWVIRQALALRAAHPEWFGPAGRYTPLYAAESAGPGRPAARTATGRAQVYPAPEPVDPQGLDPQALELYEAAGAAVSAPGRVAVTGAGAPPEAAAPPEGDPLVAYLRAEQVLVAVPRLVTRRRADWPNLRLDVPPGRWRNLLTHELIEGGPVTLADLWGRFPVALLVRAADDGI